MWVYLCNIAVCEVRLFYLSVGGYIVETRKWKLPTGVYPWFGKTGSPRRNCFLSTSLLDLLPPIPTRIRLSNSACVNSCKLPSYTACDNSTITAVVLYAHTSRSVVCVRCTLVVTNWPPQGPGFFNVLRAAVTTIALYFDYVITVFFINCIIINHVPCFRVKKPVEKFSALLL